MPKVVSSARAMTIKRLVWHKLAMVAKRKHDVWRLAVVAMKRGRLVSSLAHSSVGPLANSHQYFARVWLAFVNALWFDVLCDVGKRQLRTVLASASRMSVPKSIIQLSRGRCVMSRPFAHGVTTSLFGRAVWVGLVEPLLGQFAGQCRRAVLLDADESSAGVFGKRLGFGEVDAFASGQIGMNRRNFKPIQPIATVNRKNRPKSK